MNRKTISNIVGLVGCIASLAVGWQAVRFCQGDIGAPLLDLFNSVWHKPKDVDGSLFSPLGTLALGFYYIGGISHWIALGGLGLYLSETCRRIVEVGWTQYRSEEREASELAQQQAERQALKDRRRELRRKLNEAQQPRKSSSFSFASFLIGLIAGWLLFK